MLSSENHFSWRTPIHPPARIQPLHNVGQHRPYYLSCLHQIVKAEREAIRELKTLPRIVLPPSEYKAAAIS